MGGGKRGERILFYFDIFKCVSAQMVPTKST